MPFGLDLVSYGYTALQDAIGKLYVNQSMSKNNYLLDLSGNQTNYLYYIVNVAIL